jgi:hypothetical protein
MSKNTAKDPLEAAKLGADGKAPEKDGKAQAAELLAYVKREIPGGLPEGSPFATMKRDDLLQSANAAKMPLGVFYTDDELRLVMHYGHTRLERAPLVTTPQGAQQREPQPPVPEQSPPPPPPRSRAREPRRFPESENKKWIVVGDNAGKPKTASIDGQMVKLHPGTTIEARHYAGGEAAVRSLFNQGIDLEPDEG